MDNCLAFFDDIKNEIYEAVLYRSDYWTKNPKDIRS